MNQPFIQNAIKEGVKGAASELTSQAKTTLTNEIKKNIEDFKNRSQIVRDYNSSLDLFMMRYEARKSLFMKISHFYGSKPWWLKLTLGALVVTAAVLIGAIFHWAIAVCVGLFAASALVITHLFLQENYSVDQGRRARIQEDILNLENQTKKSVKHFQAVEKKIKTIIEELETKNITLTEENEAFHKQVDALKMQNANLDKTMNELDEAKSALIEHANELALLKKTNDSLQTSNETLDTQSMDFEATIDDFKNSNFQMQETVVSLKQTLSVINSSNESYKELNQLVKESHDLHTSLLKPPAHSEDFQELMRKTDETLQFAKNSRVRDPNEESTDAFIARIKKQRKSRKSLNPTQTPHALFSNPTTLARQQALNPQPAAAPDIRGAQ